MVRDSAGTTQVRLSGDRCSLDKKQHMKTGVKLHVLVFLPLLFVLRATSESSEVRECDITRTLRIIWSVNTFLLLLVLLAA